MGMEIDLLFLELDSIYFFKEEKKKKLEICGSCEFDFLKNANIFII